MSLFDTFGIPELFDSHAHLFKISFIELAEVIKNAQNAGLNAVFNMGIDVETSTKVIEQSKISPDFLKPFVGIDPEVFEPGSELFVGFDNKEEYIHNQMAAILELINQNRQLITGIGETGMDYYHIKNLDSKIQEQSKKLQRVLFEKHLEIASKFKLPLSIHSRDAEVDCLEIVKNYNTVGIFHSYGGDYLTAVKILDAGWGLGVNGIVTFKKADERREIFKKIMGKVSSDSSPVDFYTKGIFFETDSPFLAPEGKRGTTNEPANTTIIFDSFIKFLQ